MGSLPSIKPLDLFTGLDNEDGNPRLVTDPSPENIRKFMGEVEWLHPDALSESVITAVFEPALKSELREYLAPGTNEYLLNTVFPGITVPIQFLAAEVDIVWNSEEQGRPIFEDLVSRFTNCLEVDAAILPQGGHNYEFSQNVGLLIERRREFVEKLSSC
ncbi:hypothetical protein BJX99DRAFT_225877 [Aspergillus californicus]